MRRLLLYFLFGNLTLAASFAQSNLHKIEFEHFTESKGDSPQQLITELPQGGLVFSNIPLNSTSGLGKKFNFHGNVVVVEQMDRMADGSIQVILRREDNRDFFGYKPTLKAILRPVDNSVN